MRAKFDACQTGVLDGVRSSQAYGLVLWEHDDVARDGGGEQRLMRVRRGVRSVLRESPAGRRSSVSLSYRDEWMMAVLVPYDASSLLCLVAAALDEPAGHPSCAPAQQPCQLVHHP